MIWSYSLQKFNSVLPECAFLTGDDFSKREIKVRTREEEEDEIKEADKVNETVLGKEKSGGPEKDEGVNKDAEGKDEGEATVIGNLRLRVPKYNPEVAVGELHCYVARSSARGCSAGRAGARAMLQTSISVC